MMRVHRAVTLFVASMLIPVVGASQEESLRLRRLNAQAGSPLQSAGAMFNDTSLKVLLVNVSGREVKEVVLGVVLQDGTSATPPVTRSGQACSASVPPEGFLVVTERNSGFDMAPSHFRDKGIGQKEVVVGVIRVRFADGGAWTYPLEAKGRFEEQADDTLREKILALTRKQFEDKDVSWASLGPGREGRVSTCRER